MFRIFNRPFGICLIIMITALFLTSTKQTVQGETIKEEQEIDLERKFPNYYPKKFDEIGAVTRVGDNDIIIGDKQYPLSSSVRFGSFKDKHMNKSDLREGDLVGYLINKAGQITSLWKLQE